jgi:hypothetical protein
VVVAKAQQSLIGKERNECVAQCNWMRPHAYTSDLGRCLYSSHGSVSPWTCCHPDTDECPLLHSSPPLTSEVRFALSFWPTFIQLVPPDSSLRQSPSHCFSLIRSSLWGKTPFLQITWGLEDGTCAAVVKVLDLSRHSACLLSPHTKDSKDVTMGQHSHSHFRTFHSKRLRDKLVAQTEDTAFSRISMRIPLQRWGGGLGKMGQTRAPFLHPTSCPQQPARWRLLLSHVTDGSLKGEHSNNFLQAHEMGGSRSRTRVDSFAAQSHLWCCPDFLLSGLPPTPVAERNRQISSRLLSIVTQQESKLFLEDRD